MNSAEKNGKVRYFALGAGGRKFESYRPDHSYQALTVLAVGAFLLRSAQEVRKVQDLGIKITILKDCPKPLPT